MARKPNQKLKILYLMRFFLEQTDEEHSITIADMQMELERYGISSERKSLYDDIETLKTFGLDIGVKKTRGTEYYLASRDFELAELKLLVDAIQCSKFVTHRKSHELIKKLEGLASKKQALSLQRQVYVANRVKSVNESIYYNVDKLHAAIAQNKKVAFKYFDYNVQKEKVFRKKGEIYYGSPYALSWDDENYYLIVYYGKYDNFVHYRVDRMSDIEVLDQLRDALPEDQRFDVADYTKKTFNMFGGEDEVVNLQFDNSLVNQVLDRFGSETVLERADEQTFKIRTVVTISGTFFSWLAMYGDKVRVVSPDHVKEKYVETLKEIISLYA